MSNLAKRRRAAEAPPAVAPAVQAVPDPEVADGARRIKLDGGKWVDMTWGLDGEDYLLLWRLQEVNASDTAAVSALYGPIMQMIEKHTIAHNLGGSILRRPLPELMAIWKAWNDFAEQVALDPTPAGA